MKSNCYIYTRVSTLVQVDGYSLDAQLEALKGYAEYRGLSVVGEYCDAGKSGKSIKGRPEFLRMMDDVVSHKDDIGFVLVFKLSRFGRNAADILKSVQTLADFGVNLVSVNESIDSSTAGGRLTLAILSAVAEIEHENIAVQFMAGKLQKISTGGWTGGPIPYGYRKSANGLTKYESEAEVVMTIFKMYGYEGASVSSIVEFLNGSEYKLIDAKTNKQKPFRFDFVRRILDNPVYCGLVSYNRRTNRKDAYGKPIAVDPSKVITVKGIHEAIVSEELWDCVRKRSEQVASENRKVNFSSYMLSGIVKCPVCGKGLSGMVCRTKRRDGSNEFCRPISYYYCTHSKKSNGRACSYVKKVNQVIVDSLVIEVLSRLQFNEEFCNRLEMAFGATEDQRSLEDNLRDLHKAITEAESLKDRLGDQMDSLDPGADGYDERYSELTARMDDAYDLMDELEEKIEETRIALSNQKERSQTLSNVSGFLSDVKRLMNKMSEVERKELCSSIIKSVELFPFDRTDGKVIRSMTFRFPITFDGINGTGNASEFKVDCSDIEIHLSEKGAVSMKKMADGSKRVVVRKPTYPAIREYVMDHFGAKVSSLNIAQTKRKYGLEVGKSYNKSKKNSISPGCTEAKEKMILEALKHFGLIDAKTTSMEEKS